MQLRKYLPLVALSLVSTTSSALPPGSPRHLRAGANHHTADDGFVAALGRAPRSGEEKLRMHAHFVAVRARLVAGKATKPELEAKRQKIIGFLDAYIAKGTTPDNTHLPWRTPVFIDDSGTICAVGYLIEQSAGRPLAQKVAEQHRYDFIEDIAKDMPEVRDWVASSGFTLDELGQIQPGYQGPDVLLWHPWELAKDEEIVDGPYANETTGMRGAIKDKRMEGAWERRGADEQLLGSGALHRGTGKWTSFHTTGAIMAEGPYVANKPNGAWRLYHESGNLAAEGSLVKGERVGRWKFYYDTKDHTPIATGKFGKTGYVAGRWKHYDKTGALLVSSVVDTPESWATKKGQLFWSVGYLLDIVPTADRIRHQIHQGSADEGSVRLDKLETRDGKERIYLRFGTDDIYDVDGNKLVSVDDGWRADDCKWSRGRKRFARAGDVSALHGLIYEATDEVCREGKLVPKTRAARITTLVDSMKEVRAASPQFIQKSRSATRRRSRI